MNSTGQNPTPSEEKDNTDNTPQVLHRIIARFRKRAREHKAISYCSLVFTLLVLCGGIYIFAAADELAQNRLGAAYAKMGDNIDRALPGLTNAIVEFRENSDRVAGAVTTTAEKISEYLKIPPTALPEAIAQDPEFRKEILNFVKEFDVRELNDLVKNLDIATVETAGAARDFSKVFSFLSSQDTQLSLLAKIVSTRVMAVILSIFLVQILVGLYRYNTRMSSYYDGRADALELSQGAKRELLEILVPILSAETIDFGKGPSSPLDRATEIAKSIISKGG